MDGIPTSILFFLFCWTLRPSGLSILLHGRFVGASVYNSDETMETVIRMQDRS
jgi:hypothetical protein